MRKRVGLRMLILVLKYGSNIEASRVSTPRPQAAQTSNLTKQMLHLSLCCHTALFFLCPARG